MLHQDVVVKIAEFADNITCVCLTFCCKYLNEYIKSLDKTLNYNILSLIRNNYWKIFDEAIKNKKVNYGTLMDEAAKYNHIEILDVLYHHSLIMGYRLPKLFSPVYTAAKNDALGALAWLLEKNFKFCPETLLSHINNRIILHYLKLKKIVTDKQIKDTYGVDFNYLDPKIKIRD